MAYEPANNYPLPEKVINGLDNPSWLGVEKWPMNPELTTSWLRK